MKLEIEDLIASKAFDELTPTEQAWVLTQMTAEAYQLQHHIVVQSQALWAEEEIGLVPPSPSAALHTALQQQAQPPQKGLLAMLLSHRIKTWQAVAASLLLCLLWQVGSMASASEKRTLQAQVPRVDTVYQYITQVKEVFQPIDTVIKIVYKEVVAPASTVAANPALLADASDSLDLEAVATASPFEDVLQYRSLPAGQPASQDTFFQLLGRELQL